MILIQNLKGHIDIKQNSLSFPRLELYSHVIDQYREKTTSCCKYRLIS